MLFLLFLGLIAACVSGFSLVSNPSDVPVISSGFKGVPPLIMDPNVYSDFDGLHLFYSTYFCLLPDGTYYYSWDPKNDSACSIGGYISAIGYAFSNDSGFSWQFRGPPVFSPGGDEWEQYKVETAFVHVNDSSVQLYYCAIGYVNGVLLDNRYQLGVAFLDLNGKSVKERFLDSSDQFERRHPSPLIPYDLTTSSFTNNVQEPSVVFRDGHYEVYFLGLQFSQPNASADSPGQEIQMVGLGRAIFDQSFAMQSVSSSPLFNTAWKVNIPEVRYSASTGQYTLLSSSLGDGGEVHHNEFLQMSHSPDGAHWSSAEAVLKPAGGEAFNGWAATSPTLLLHEDGVVESVFYCAFMSDYTSNSGVCDYSSRYGIGVPDPACIYITLGRAIPEQA